jgi:hypothetical protein
VDLQSYIDKQKPILRLSNWRIAVQIESDQVEDYFAVTDLVPGRNYATITFYPRFFSSDEQEQKVTIAHELLHCHGDRLFKHLCGAIKDHINPPTYQIWYESARIDMEHLVDDLAEVVVNLLTPYKVIRL